MRLRLSRPEPRLNPRELSVLLAMCAVWGFHFVVVKLAVGAAPPMFYAALRMTLVAVVMAPFLRWHPGHMKNVLLGGLCLGAMNYAFLFNGVAHATASASAIAIELYVPFATILSVVFLGEKVGIRRILGIALAFSGVALIALGKGEARIGYGVGLVAMSALTESAGAIFVKQARLKPQQLLAWFAVIGTLFLWSATLLFEKGQLDVLRSPNAPLIACAVVYSAIAASVIGHTAYYWLLQRLPVSLVASSALMTTLLGVTFSVVLLGDHITPRFAIGGVMALGGISLVLLRTAAGRIIEPGAPEPVAAGAEAPDLKPAERT
jgi:O-acetylserine/cysteine efflux transporter